VTTRANRAIAELHDRMPVVLEADSWAAWLDPAPDDPGELQALLIPNDAVELELYPVSRLVNDARNEGPELLRPLGE
jgi:putative SOS response-associated peptidase YedK